MQHTSPSGVTPVTACDVWKADNERGERNEKTLGYEELNLFQPSPRAACLIVIGLILYVSSNMARLCAEFEGRGLRCELEK
jgi:hypothetical protein